MLSLGTALRLAGRSAGTLLCTRCCGHCDTCFAYVVCSLQEPHGAGGRARRVSCAEFLNPLIRGCGNIARVETIRSSRSLQACFGVAQEEQGLTWSRLEEQQLCLPDLQSVGSL